MAGQWANGGSVAGLQTEPAHYRLGSSTCGNASLRPDRSPHPRPLLTDSLSNVTSAETPLVDAYRSDGTSSYLRSLWARRHYVWYVSSYELKSRQMTSALGNFWHLLNPLLQILVFYLIFGVLLETNRGVDNFIAFLTVGIFYFTFTQRVATLGATSIVGNQGLLSQLRFPRAMLPITITLTEAIAMIPSLLVIYGTSLLTGQSPRLGWLFLPVLVAIQAMFNVGAALVTARATHLVRDTTQILPFIFRLLFYVSGIIFNVDSYLSSTSPVAWLFYANPIHAYVTVARWATLGTPVDPEHIVSLTLWTVLLPIFGLWWFRRGEHAYGAD